MTSFPPIEELLLHRENMLLLKEVTAFSDAAVTCLAVPEPQAWYGNAEGAMPAWIGIELMAQAIAAHAALLARSQGKAPKAGALLGTRDYRASRPAFAAGEPLFVEAHQSFRNVDGLASYDCRVVSAAGEEISKAALTVYEPDNFEQFISGVED